jgi:predicted metallo-beta-lactamase superfamily hydrolase
MNKLSLLAMFKNEASIIEEWIEHYIREGVDHFYLIDNGSYDNYESKINKYKSKITLVKDPTRFEKKTQKILYNQHYLEKVKKETEWLIVCDIDEYFYLNDEMRLIDFLSEPPFPDAYWVPWRLFGTTHKNTPKSLVKFLLLRQKDPTGKIIGGHGKSIIRTEKLKELNVHSSDFTGKAKKIRVGFNDKLRINHYKLISEDYYKNNKCVRGGGESGHCHVYTMGRFHSDNNSFLEWKDKVLSNKLPREIYNKLPPVTKSMLSRPTAPSSPPPPPPPPPEPEPKIEVVMRKKHINENGQTVIYIDEGDAFKLPEGTNVLFAKYGASGNFVDVRDKIIIPNLGKSIKITNDTMKCNCDPCHGMKKWLTVVYTSKK